MWEKLSELGQPMNMSWLILGDFNCVKLPAEKQLGFAPTWYELKGFADCCLSLRLNDAPTTGCYFTWYSSNESNPVWCKLDRVLFNNEWLKAGLLCNAHFSPPGCLSDHSPGIVSILDLPTSQPKPFRFFNMWADHQDFIATVENVRAKEADLALQDAQLQLKSDPENAAIRDSVGELIKTVIFLTEAERHFYYQKAKLHFLKMGDQNTKFFHDMVKRNVAKSSILAIAKSDGSTITSAAEIGQEFVTYFTSLVGTKVQTLPVDNDVFNGGQSYLPSLLWSFAGQSLHWRQLNHNIIALVPKSNHCPTIADYRHISWFNVIHKAITKIIADRLAPALDTSLADARQPSLGDGALQTTSSLHRKWSGSTRGNGFLLLVVQLKSTCARHSTRYREPFYHRSCTDDLMLFSNGDLPSVHILMKYLQEFRDVSDLVVNTSNILAFPSRHRDYQLGTTRRSWIKLQTVFSNGQQSLFHLRDGWNSFVPLFRVWSVSSSKSSLSQWRSLRKSTGFAGIFFGTPEEHQLLGRIFVIPRMKVALVSGISSLGTWPSLPRYCGTSTARQTRYGYNGSTLFISEEDQFGIGNRRRAIHHSSNGLPKSATELLLHLASQRRLSSTWPDGVATRGSRRPKHMSYLHMTDLCSFKRIARAHYALILKNRPSTCSLSAPFSDFVWSHIQYWLGISRRMSTLLSAVKWLIKEKTRSSVQNKARLIALACTIYSPGRHQNEVIFEGSKLSSELSSSRVWSSIDAHVGEGANVLKGICGGFVEVPHGLDDRCHVYEYGIRGFPTIKVFAPGKPPVDYQGARDVKPIADFAYQQIKALLKERLNGKSAEGSSQKSEPSASVELNSRNFDELVIKSKELWLVEFFAPWCGHCKKLAPEWKKAANNLKGQVKLGHVDCDAEKVNYQSLMSRFNVQGFPTILVFGADKESPFPYEGARSASAIESFALEQLETNAAPPEVTELTSTDVMEEKCGPAAICFIAFLPDILDSKAEGRNNYLWVAAGKQPDLEKHVGVGGYGYPALVALNLKKKAYAPLKSAFERDHIIEFVKEAGRGGKGNLPLEGSPEILKTEPWDGKDGQIIEEDEFSLDELMGDDNSSKDES
ncbi:UNVERIFIED_CONTAM: protein disulfide isomerase-like 2-3 [Sesamum calycinum]|uniref:Protein disulfide isomerase-like 2-3 n=1 Tax=Sesamum calycinum TaxID=2727403 RepID=A0AAW2Q398_9LAMI